jgi:hypothetical protein
MNNLVGKFVSMWTRPADAMRSVKEEGDLVSLAPSMIFIVVMALISGVITAIWGMIVPPPGLSGGPSGAVWMAALFVPLASFIGSFIGAFIIWGLVDGLLNGTAAQYKLSYRMLALLAAFSPVSALLAPIPKVGQYLAIAVNLWATIVMIRGIIIVRETRPVRTWVVCGLIFGLLFTIGLFARVAAQRQVAGGQPGFNDFASDEDLGLDEDLDAKLDDLANDAKKAPAEAPKK